MESSTWLWILLAVVLLAVLVGAALTGRRKKLERDRHRAHEIREEAVAGASELQRREAHAREAEADAARARAEADRKLAEAERLEAEARDRAGSASEARAEHDERLREADKLDPDVDHKHAHAEVGDHGPEQHTADHDPRTTRTTGPAHDGAPATAGSVAGTDADGTHPATHEPTTQDPVPERERETAPHIPGQTTRVEGEHPDSGSADDSGRHRA